MEDIATLSMTICILFPGLKAIKKPGHNLNENLKCNSDYIYKNRNMHMCEYGYT